MTLRSKPFSVNEKVILYVLILIMLPFSYAFPATLYISSYRFISPCTGAQSNYHDIYSGSCTWWVTSGFKYVDGHEVSFRYFFGQSRCI